jgi:TctA family transporter
MTMRTKLLITVAFLAGAAIPVSAYAGEVLHGAAVGAGVGIITGVGPGTGATVGAISGGVKKHNNKKKEQSN